MPYIGNTPALDYISYAVQNFTVTAGTTSYALDYSVANENDIRLVINNVIQRPGASFAYSATGTTLTLTSATLATDTMYAVFIGRAVQTVTPPANINIQLADGTAAAPSLNFANDTNTGIFRPTTDTIAFTEGGPEAMRIDSDGDVGIGTTSPAVKLDVIGTTTSALRLRSSAASNGFNIYNDSVNDIAHLNNFFSGSMVFSTTNTERMRIDSSGNLLVGATSAATPTGVTSKFVSQGAFTGSNFGAAISSTAATGVDHYYISFQTATITQRGYIYYNNGAGQVQLSATSDIRLKENIVDAPLALPILEQVKVRQYDWKETGNTNVGFVAQELYDVIPRAVAVGEDNEDGSIKRVWGVDNGTLVPYLVKAIQEQQAIIKQLEARLTSQQTKIDSLEARLTTLENN